MNVLICSPGAMTVLCADGARGGWVCLFVFCFFTKHVQTAFGFTTSPTPSFCYLFPFLCCLHCMTFLPLVRYMLYFIMFLMH